MPLTSWQGQDQSGPSSQLLYLLIEVILSTISCSQVVWYDWWPSAHSLIAGNHKNCFEFLAQPLGSSLLSCYPKICFLSTTELAHLCSFHRNLEYCSHNTVECNKNPFIHWWCFVIYPWLLTQCCCLTWALAFTAWLTNRNSLTEWSSQGQ